MRLLELIVVTFDTMENHNPIEERSLGMFSDTDEQATVKINKYLSELTPVLYLGYDHTIYPHYKIKEHILN